MTGQPLFDWALLTISLFNAILMLWLGLTVWLNAEHRAPPGRSSRWGFWIAGGSLLLGSLFFVAHTAVLGLGLDRILSGLEIWWRVGWLPLIALPFAWYAEMLWYAGFWEEPDSPLARRHRLWFIAAAGMAVAGIAIALLTDPIPEVIAWESVGPTLGNIPVFLLIYPLYIIGCVVLAFDAQYRPGPTSRLMGDLARRRARPWMNGATVVLVAVCLLVGYAMAWILRNWFPYQPTREAIFAVMMLDLAIAALIALATLLIGQSIFAYEVFTGHILPRRGLGRDWRNAIGLAAGFGLAVGGSLAYQLLPMYSLLLMVLLTVVVYAFLTWHSFRERDVYIASLRPFFTSQQLLDRLTGEAEPIPAMDAAIPFRSLCREMLGARKAILLSIGPMAPLWGAPLVFPEDVHASLPEIHFPPGPPYPLAVPWSDDRYPDLCWMVPLWSQRGPIGALLLGEKSDGGLYAREDFEIAQSACERLLDSHASAELARQLVSLQRERRIGGQVSDRRTRRSLHDDILPALHAVLLRLNDSVGGRADAVPALQELAAVHQRIAHLLHEIPLPPPDISSHGLAPSLQRIVDSETADSFDAVAWNIDPAAASAADALPDFSVEVLYYAAREAIRNAAQHGRGENAACQLELHVAFILRNHTLEISVADNGVGIPAAGGSRNGNGGHGLDLHGTMMAVIGGELILGGAAGGGTCVILRLPL